MIFKEFLLYMGLLNIMAKDMGDLKQKVRNDLINQSNQRLIKSGHLIVDVSSFQNGFQKEAEKYCQEIWDYI
jgi:hypothetical protein